MSIKSFIERT